METLVFYITVLGIIIVGFILGFKAPAVVIKYKLNIQNIAYDLFLVYLFLCKKTKVSIPYRIVHKARLENINNNKPKNEKQAKQDVRSEVRDEEAWQKVVYMDAEGNIISIKDVKKEKF